MAKGRKRTPLKVLKLRDSQWANENYKCAYRKDEPEPDLIKPECPEWLSEKAKSVWNDMIELLYNMQVLSKIDGNALARYCACYAQYKDAYQFIKKNGEMYKTTNQRGEPEFKPFPQVHIANNLCSTLAKLESEFGLTPVARTRIKVDNKGKKKDKFEEFA